MNYYDINDKKHKLFKNKLNNVTTKMIKMYVIM